MANKEDKTDWRRVYKIAAEVGVDPRTVARFLRGEPGRSAPIENALEKAAQKIGPTP